MKAKNYVRSFFVQVSRQRHSSVDNSHGQQVLKGFIHTVVTGDEIVVSSLSLTRRLRGAVRSISSYGSVVVGIVVA